MLTSPPNKITEEALPYFYEPPMSLRTFYQQVDARVATTFGEACLATLRTHNLQLYKKATKKFVDIMDYPENSPEIQELIEYIERNWYKE